MTNHTPAKREFAGINLDDMIQNSERLRYASSLNGITDIKTDMMQKVQCLRDMTPW